MPRLLRTTRRPAQTPDEALIPVSHPSHPRNRDRNMEHNGEAGPRTEPEYVEITSSDEETHGTYCTGLYVPQNIIDFD
jgi:hypothetical protein